MTDILDDNGMYVPGTDVVYFNWFNVPAGETPAVPFVQGTVVDIDGDYYAIEMVTGSSMWVFRHHVVAGTWHSKIRYTVFAHAEYGITRITRRYDAAMIDETIHSERIASLGRTLPLALVVKTVTPVVESITDNGYKHTEEFDILASRVELYRMIP